MNLFFYNIGTLKMEGLDHLHFYSRGEYSYEQVTLALLEYSLQSNVLFTTQKQNIYEEKE